MCTHVPASPYNHRNETQVKSGLHRLDLRPEALLLLLNLESATSPHMSDTSITSHVSLDLGLLKLIL